MAYNGNNHFSIIASIILAITVVSTSIAAGFVQYDQYSSGDKVTNNFMDIQMASATSEDEEQTDEEQTDEEQTDEEQTIQPGGPRQFAGGQLPPGIVPPEECQEGQVLNPDTGQCEPLPEECQEGQVLNPDTGQCEPLSVLGPATTGQCPEGQIYNNATGACEFTQSSDEGTIIEVEGDCVAVATSEAENASSSAAAASVTCIDQEINNIYRQQLVSRPTTDPIVESDSMKLGRSRLDSNNAIVVADFSPFRIVGGHVSANLPIGNDVQTVVGEIDIRGILSKAVALPLVEARTLTTNDVLYSTELGSTVQGRDIFTGNRVTITSPNIIILYNVGDVVTFLGPSSIAYTAILS